MKVTNSENIQNQLSAKNDQLQNKIEELLLEISDLKDKLHKVTEQRNEWR